MFCAPTLRLLCVFLAFPCGIHDAFGTSVREALVDEPKKASAMAGFTGHVGAERLLVLDWMAVTCRSTVAAVADTRALKTPSEMLEGL